MTEQEERWQYIAEYRYDEATVTKVRLRETPLNWRVLEAIPVIGSRSQPAGWRTDPQDPIQG